MKPFGVGIIGCGNISKSHIRGYMKLSGQCEIRAVSDVVLDKAQEKAAEIGEHVVAYEDYNELLAREDIDVISICTPPFMHKEPVVAALKAGKHVLCEKPFAPSLSDCDIMIDTAQAHHRKLAVVFQYRYRQDFRQAHAVLQSNALGPIQYAQMNAEYWRGDNYYNVPWRGRFETECGGVTMNHAIHPLDVFLWLMGDVDSVQAEIDTVAHRIEVEDISMAAIRFKSGTLAQVNCTLNAVSSNIAMTFSGKTKALSLSNAASVQGPQFHAIGEAPNGFGRKDEEAVAELQRIAAQITEGTTDHTGPIQDLFQAIHEDRDPVVCGQEGRRSIEVITAIYKSATLGQRVVLPIDKDDPWYTTEGILQHVKKAPLKGGGVR